MADDYHRGDHWVVDDRTGARIRASESVKEWNGAVVHRDEAEPRHPQDFVRGRRDRQSVKDPRPEPPPIYGGPPSTTLSAAALAGATALTVASTASFSVSDRIGIMLDNGDRHSATVSAVTDATHLSFTPALPWAAAIGAAVIDYSAVPAADIG